MAVAVTTVFCTQFHYIPKVPVRFDPKNYPRRSDRTSDPEGTTFRFESRHTEAMLIQQIRIPDRSDG